MTTILTPVDELKEGAEFMIGATEYRFADSRAYAYASDSNSSVPLFYTLQLHYIFPDGVPVIQPDKPKEVRCVVTVDEDGTPRVDGEICVSVGDWLDILLENSKTYDLVLTEREDSK